MQIKSESLSTCPVVKVRYDSFQPFSGDQFLLIMTSFLLIMKSQSSIIFLFVECNAIPYNYFRVINELILIWLPSVTDNLKQPFSFLFFLENPPPFF